MALFPIFVFSPKSSGGLFYHVLFACPECFRLTMCSWARGSPQVCRPLPSLTCAALSAFGGDSHHLLSFSILFRLCSSPELAPLVFFVGFLGSVSFPLPRRAHPWAYNELTMIKVLYFGDASKVSFWMYSRSCRLLCLFEGLPLQRPRKGIHKNAHHLGD